MIKNDKLIKEEPLSPTVPSLKGALKRKNISETDYKNYLEKKYS